MRLIDADALLYGFDVRKVVEYDESGCGMDYKAVSVEAIENAPAVDAEPVTYCKDCIHRGNDVECPMCTMEFTWDEDDGSDYYWIDRTADDGFCHCGAKMEAEG